MQTENTSAGTLTADEIRRRAERIKWFHTIDLGHGIVTRGDDRTPAKIARIGLPGDLRGKTVLDVGAWDGAFSFEAARRGAERVVAVDSFSWSGAGWGTKDGFLLAREALGLPVEDREIEVEALSPTVIGTFDVVLFLGVLYHMRHPLLCLEKAAGVTADLLIVETAVDLIGMRAPAAAFYVGDELGKDSTNWWAPNPRGLHAMLRAAGFSRVRTVAPPRPLLRRIGRALNVLVREGRSPFRTYRRGRIVVHARK